ncbi:terpenoid synthase [Xylaria cf. heliscus]|nr:terpenoid synthase [Xylaria cf. heliscus]
MTQAPGIESCNREDLLKLMRGSSIKIPDLRPMISHWPQGVHPEAERLRKLVVNDVNRILSPTGDEDRISKVQESALELFAASWWAYAPFDALYIGARLAIWLFTWDDETDSLEFTSLMGNYDRACEFRKETLAYLKASLSKERTYPLSDISTNTIITNFEPVAEALLKCYNDRQLADITNDLLFYINMCEEEHKTQEAGRLPSVDEYLERRMGSGAVRVCLGLTEYACGIRLPDEIMKHEAMVAIWHETNLSISITNDILSLKKEIDQSQVDTVVPLLAARLGSVQDAINHAVDLLQSSVHRLEEAEQYLLRQLPDTPGLYDDVESFIRGCKYACTTNLNWSLKSSRYGKMEKLFHEGYICLDL